MKKPTVIRICLLASLFAPLLIGCASPSSANSSSHFSQKGEEIALPEAFYNRNFAVVAGNWNECGCALIIGERGEVEIQNVSSHNDFYDIDFSLLPMYKGEADGKATYFLPFSVTGQVIDDGYFKNGNEYRFFLRYESNEYYCAVSKNDPSAEPEKILMEGMM